MATTPSYHGDYSDREQPTLRKISDYVRDARTLLQDVIQPYRYDDPSMLVSMNVTLLEAFRLRPDLFVYNDFDGQVQSFTAVDDTVVDIEPPFRLAILHGLCGHALERDQEDIQDRRATVFLNLFSTGLTGRTLGVIAGGAPPNRRGAEG